MNEFGFSTRDEIVEYKSIQQIIREHRQKVIAETKPAVPSEESSELKPEEK
jgi:hypothetical protein